MGWSPVPLPPPRRRPRRARPLPQSLPQGEGGLRGAVRPLPPCGGDEREGSGRGGPPSPPPTRRARRARPLPQSPHKGREAPPSPLSRWERVGVRAGGGERGPASGFWPLPPCGGDEREGSGWCGGPLPQSLPQGEGGLTWALPSGLSPLVGEMRERGRGGAGPPQLTIM